MTMKENSEWLKKICERKKYMYFNHRKNAAQYALYYHLYDYNE